MTEREALKLALSTLNEVRSETFRLMRNGQTLYAEKKVWDTMFAIKEALANVATNDTSQERVDKTSEIVHEPVCDKDPQGCWNVRCQLGKKCKNTPPQRKPLSDEEILTYKHMIDWTSEWSYINFARAIEAAHGIKGEA